MITRRSKSGLILPTFSSIPAYYKTFGDEVADLCAEAGYPPDPQQRLALDVLFGRDARGLSTAFEVALFVCRQNMKSATFKMAALGWLFLFDERLIVYSAHEFQTAMEMFRDVEELVTNCDFLRREVKRIIRNHGEEAIETISGARLIFKTRTKGGGRGLSGRKVILDEAYALRPMHMGALLPTLSAQPDPQVVYGSAAGMADSDVIQDVRDRGRGVDAEGGPAQTDPRLGYLEWCAPPPEEACDKGTRCTHAKTAVGCGCDKPDMWLMANPALGERISVEYVKAERRAMPVGEFCRERMGWWDDPEKGVSPIKLNDWLARADRHSTIHAHSPVALAIHVADDSSFSAIGIAGYRDEFDEEQDPNERVVHGELVEYLPGTGWLIDRLIEICANRHPCVVVLDPATPAGAFEKLLRLKKFVTRQVNDPKPVMLKSGERLMMLVTAREYAQASGALINAVANKLFVHPDQDQLNEAIKVTRAKDSAGAKAFEAEEGFDISPVIAVTLAKLGLDTFGSKPPLKPFFLS